MNRLKVGDRAAFAALYDRYAPRLHGLLLRMLGSRPSAEDVLQEVFWQVWSRCAQYDAQRSSPSAWLMLIARSRARDHLRRRRSGQQPLADSEVTTVEPAAEMERREAADQAAESLTRLPLEQREAISLAFYSGMTYEQIARQQSVPLGTIKTRIRRGMLRLRDMLNESCVTGGHRDEC